MRRLAVAAAAVLALMCGTACIGSDGQLTPEGRLIAEAMGHNDYIAQVVNHQLHYTPGVLHEPDLLSAEDEVALAKYVADAKAAATSYRAVWDVIAECESGHTWDYNGSSGFDGGLQFEPSTWRAYGGEQYAPYAYQATKLEQIEIAERTLAGQGWGAWPTCARKAGLL